MLQHWSSIHHGGAAILTGLTTTGTFTRTVLSAQSTSTFTGMATFNGGITVTGADQQLDKLNAKLVDGTAGATPSIAFDNSTTTGLLRSDTNVIGVTGAGTETFRLDATGLDTPKIQIDSTLGSNSIL